LSLTSFFTAEILWRHSWEGSRGEIKTKLMFTYSIKIIKNIEIYRWWDKTNPPINLLSRTFDNRTLFKEILCKNLFIGSKIIFTFKLRRRINLNFYFINFIHFLTLSVLKIWWFSFHTKTLLLAHIIILPCLNWVKGWKHMKNFVKLFTLSTKFFIRFLNLSVYLNNFIICIQ
jgi:hypothetical protein